MNSQIFCTIFLILFIFVHFLQWFLNHLNRKNILAHGDDSAKPYSLAGLTFDNWDLLFSALFTLALLFSGILPFLDRFLFSHFGDSLHREALFLIAIAVISTLVHMPMQIYSTFGIEGKFGFNTLTWGLYWRDTFKSFLISILLGIPLLYFLLFLLQATGKYWWAWTFAAFFLFQIILMVVYPIFIAPWFNRFSPLPDGPLRNSLLDLAKRLNFPASEIYVMDGSRRSLHSNAYFTGFGKWRRIVFYDTLMQQLNDEELAGVLAHEIGHYKLKHIYKMMVKQILILGGIFFLASLAIKWSPLYETFHFELEQASAAIGLYLFFQALAPVSTLFSPLQNATSRRYEFEADAFAKKAIVNVESMKSALQKISEKNLSNKYPHPWYRAFHYSHPSLDERLAALDQK